MSGGETKKLKRFESTNKLLRIVILFSFIFVILYLVLIFSPLVLFLLLMILGPILAFWGDFQEAKGIKAKKVGYCIICGQKIRIDKKLCPNCFKEYDLIKWNQYYQFFCF